MGDFSEAIVYFEQALNLRGRRRPAATGEPALAAGDSVRRARPAGGGDRQGRRGGGDLEVYGTAPSRLVRSRIPGNIAAGRLEQLAGAAGGVSGADGSSGDDSGGSNVATVTASQFNQGTAAAHKTDGPGLLRMAISATKAMAKFVGSGSKTTPNEIQRQRLATCAGCEHHTGLRCKICGCFTNPKSRMLHEDCPIGKWTA